MSVEADQQQVFYDREKYRTGPPKTGLLMLENGQLALLTVRAAHKAGMLVSVAGKNPDSCTGPNAPESYPTVDGKPNFAKADAFYVRDVNKGEGLDEPSESTQAVALDTEHVAARFWADFKGQADLLFPPSILPITQNKRDQHLFLRDVEASSLPGNKLPMPEFNDQIQTFEDFQRAAQRFGFQGVLQTGSGAYDGRGNALVMSAQDLEAAWNKLGTKGSLFFEKLVPFERELTVQAVRGWYGETVIMPPIFSTHVDGQLYLAECSADFTGRVKDDAIAVTKALSEAVPGIGLLTVELFQQNLDGLSPDELSVLINEFCIGRPHNSGHHSIDGLTQSQFDYIVRLARRLPIREPAFNSDITQSSMLNLLTTRTGGKEIHGIEELMAETGLIVYTYGKNARDDRRKFGHLAATGTDPQECRDRLQFGLERLNEFNDNLFLYSPAAFTHREAPLNSSY